MIPLNFLIQKQYFTQNHTNLHTPAGVQPDNEILMHLVMMCP